MPFASDKQRRYLWSQKPEVAKKFADHKAEGGFTEDGIATHYRNGKKKPQDQIDYERRVKETNATLAKDPLLQTAISLSPLALPLAVDKGIKTGEWGDAALEGAGALAGPLAGGAFKLGKNAWKARDLIGGAVKDGLDPEYAKLAGREIFGLAEPAAKSAGAMSMQEAIQAAIKSGAKGGDIGPTARRIMSGGDEVAAAPLAAKKSEGFVDVGKLHPMRNKRKRDLSMAEKGEITRAKKQVEGAARQAGSTNPHAFVQAVDHGLVPNTKEGMQMINTAQDLARQGKVKNVGAAQRGFSSSGRSEGTAFNGIVNVNGKDIPVLAAPHASGKGYHIVTVRAGGKMYEEGGFVGPLGGM